MLVSTCPVASTAKKLMPSRDILYILFVINKANPKWQSFCWDSRGRGFESLLMGETHHRLIIRGTTGNALFYDYVVKAS